MARFLAPIALALSIAFTGAALADQNEGLKIAAGTSALTPHGVWDGR